MSLSPKSYIVSQNMKMPIVGLGTWQATGEETSTAIRAALETGYRHIDTAFAYKNEDYIGKELQNWFTNGKVKREDLFITTKLPIIGNRAEDVETFIKKSLKSLKLEYVDLYLIHAPIGLNYVDDDTMFPTKENGEVDIDVSTDLISVWKAMEDMVDKGYTKAIGVSNFNSKQIEKILKSCRIHPANLQVEMHIYYQQKELHEFCNRNNMTLVAYAPLGSPGMAQYTKRVLGASNESLPKTSPMDDPVVIDIGKKHGKTSAQILLRFLMQLGVAVIPKSVTPMRIKQNFEIFDFELNENEMKKLKDLDKGKDGRMFHLRWNGIDKHPEYPF